MIAVSRLGSTPRWAATAGSSLLLPSRALGSGGSSSHASLNMLVNQRSVSLGSVNHSQHNSTGHLHHNMTAPQQAMTNETFRLAPYHFAPAAQQQVVGPFQKHAGDTHLLERIDCPEPDRQCKRRQVGRLLDEGVSQ